MRWGKRWGMFRGWPPGPGSIPQEVDVMIVKGKFVPCTSCHWRGVCVVPKNSFHANLNSSPIRNYYHCEDYLSKDAQGIDQWNSAMF